jgi:hypothetical protein
MPPTKIVKIGFQRLDGLGEIIHHTFPCDMGDHGRVTMLKNINIFDPFNGPRKGTFSYYNKETGNVVYREVEDHELDNKVEKQGLKR